MDSCFGWHVDILTAAGIRSKIGLFMLHVCEWLLTRFDIIHVHCTQQRKKNRKKCDTKHAMQPNALGLIIRISTGGREKKKKEKERATKLANLGIPSTLK